MEIGIERQRSLERHEGIGGMSAIRHYAQVRRDDRVAWLDALGVAQRSGSRVESPLCGLASCQAKVCIG